MAKVRIAWDNGEVIADLRSTPTVARLLAALPCTGSAHTWGEEIYFEVPFTAPLETDAQQVVDPGTLCYWVDGRSLALPYGRTPVSKGSESRLVSPCNVLGKVDGDPRALKAVRDGVRIRVELVSS
jgi:hypothetical protein